MLYFMGRSSVRIETPGGYVIYIDPYAGSAKDYEKPADLVLITHQHGDHNRTDLITMKSSGKVFNCPLTIKSGDIKIRDNIKVTAVDAYNKNHPKNECCGFIIEISDVVIYHSGDTSTTDQMTEFPKYHIDYALLCADGNYNMGPDEAMEVASIIRAKTVIPIHTSASGTYSQKNMDLFTIKNIIRMKPGDKTVINN